MHYKFAFICIKKKKLPYSTQNKTCSLKGRILGGEGGDFPPESIFNE
jgi:hypothetical protein